VVILPQNRYFGVVLTGHRVTGLILVFHLL